MFQRVECTEKRVHSKYNNCTKLESVVFQENMKLKSLSYFTFYGTNLTVLDIPSSVSSVRKYTFNMMPNLRVLYIHSFMKSISSEAFIGIDASSIELHVPYNYPNKTILGIPLLKDLESPKKQTRCFCNSSTNRISLLSALLVLTLVKI